MSFSFLDAKKEARQAVHDTFAVPATYSDDVETTPVAMNVRYHSQRATEVLLPGQGLAEVMEAVPRVLFSVAELTALGVTPRRNGVLIFAGYDNLTLALDTEEKYDGPVYVSWTAVQR